MDEGDCILPHTNVSTLNVGCVKWQILLFSGDANACAKVRARFYDFSSPHQVDCGGTWYIHAITNLLCLSLIRFMKSDHFQPRVTVVSFVMSILTIGKIA